MSYDTVAQCVGRLVGLAREAADCPISPPLPAQRRFAHWVVLTNPSNRTGLQREKLLTRFMVNKSFSHNTPAKAPAAVNRR